MLVKETLLQIVGERTNWTQKYASTNVHSGGSITFQILQGDNIYRAAENCVTEKSEQGQLVKYGQNLLAATSNLDSYYFWTVG